MHSFRWPLFLLTLAMVGTVRADGPGDNLPDRVRPVPPRGIDVPEADRSALQSGVDALQGEIDRLRKELAHKPELLKLLPDVQIYERAVRSALQHNEFFRPQEIGVAKNLLERGRERARQLRAGQAPWDAATGLVVRGYVSKIDGSVQPYGLVVPASYRPNSAHQFRLDVWCHGRGETLSEVNFINGREKSPGEFAPPNAFVLHPYGRYCNANRFAGEVDLFEALDDIRKHYPIDENRLVMRGFSMGGAACWQFAVHYPSLWAAAAPGAGFSETADFLKVFQREKVQPTWYEQKLWHLYDSTDYAINLYQCPTVAYSGEIDQQKQAADMMAQALKKVEIEMAHVIGAKAKHHYTAEARAEINRRIDSIVRLGRRPPDRDIHFTTWTLRYNQCGWIRIDGLERHWERAQVDFDRFGGPSGNILHFVPMIQTRNVSALTIAIPSGFENDITMEEGPGLMIDGQRVVSPKPLSDRSWTAHFRKSGSLWRSVPNVDDGTLCKRHGLQGPIDDAFMDSFVMVRPTGKPLNEKAGNWTNSELAHALDHWRKQFRGEARVKDDKDISAADIAAHNLVLWGDPSSNVVLAKVLEKLPVQWDREHVGLAGQTFDAGHHVPVMIYPNPLNPKRYVVLNSGPTFREYHYLSNARQTPKLPDFAIVDIDVPVSSRSPGGIVTAGFFDESWKPRDDRH